MVEWISSDLSPELQDRLTAAGVHDEASFQQALDADPALRHEIEAFLKTNQLSIDQETGENLLSAFLKATDRKVLESIWEQAPLEQIVVLVDAVEMQIDKARQEGNNYLAEALQKRLDDFRRFHAEQQELASHLKGWTEALVSTSDIAQIAQIWKEIPVSRKDSVLNHVDQRAEELAQSGDSGTAKHIRNNVAVLREVQQHERELEHMPQHAKALLEFLVAETDDAARLVFTEWRELLQPFEAQQLMDDLVKDVDDRRREHFSARRTLLSILRGAVPLTVGGESTPTPPIAKTPSTTFSNAKVSIEGDLYQAGGNIYINSAHVEGSGNAIVYNNICLERRWTRPRPPQLLQDTIERDADLTEVKKKLAARGELAISGRIAALTVQGMPGIGKTTLAKQLALALDSSYLDGVIWEDIGSEIRSPDQVQPILNRWARFALVVPQNQSSAIQFEPGAVRALLGEYSHLLIVLDNVWSLSAIRPLREALPPAAHLVITTRSRKVMIDLGGERHELDKLTLSDAHKLIALRLGWDEISPENLSWCDGLVEGVGRHTLALDVALGLLLREGERVEDWRKSAERIIAYVRTGYNLDDLRLEDDDRDHNVELVLSYSYTCMDASVQGRFRVLGSFAPAATFSTAHVAALWQCDESTAKRQLNDFVNSALLSRAESADRWRQHELLRAYALALLRREGEYDAVAAHHAEVYEDLIRAADKAEAFYSMLPEYSQLRHAFGWAVENNLRIMHTLINSCADLQAAFGLNRENLAWCEQAVTAAQRRGMTSDIAGVQVLLGNALQRISSLDGEDRGERLFAALAAYGKALTFYQPDTTPTEYASTQNNRALVLQDIASLPNEDHRRNLLAALKAHDEALKIRRPETMPLEYASTQNNRAVVLQKIASLPNEDRRERLIAALAAHDEALRFYRSDATPLGYAMTQCNRAGVLQEVARLPNEDRYQRLFAVLAAYDEALMFYRPDTEPRAYASTQHNRAVALEEIAGLPKQDPRERLLAALAASDEALKIRRSETDPLAYADTQHNRASLLYKMASLPNEDRRERLMAALTACDEALKIRRPETMPLAYAETQHNRVNILHTVAGLPNENWRERLLAALAACDEALRFRRPDTAPFEYASTQNSRANLLNDLATLPNEDRRERLLAALAAYDEALRFYRSDTAPLEYAMTQHNRALQLQDIADLPNEDRRERLMAALAACDEALRFYQPDTAPLEFAGTQNNRANVLKHIADLPNENRRERLMTALAACDEALKIKQPDTAPLGYAGTQLNRANVLMNIADLPNEDRRGRLMAALAALNEALRFFRPDTAPFEYASTQNNRANVLQHIADLPNEDRRWHLMAALAAYDESLKIQRLDTAPLNHAMIHGNLFDLYLTMADLPRENRQKFLAKALRSGWTAFSLFDELQHVRYRQTAMQQLVNLRAICGLDFTTFWRALTADAPPDWLSSSTAEQEAGEKLKQLFPRFVSVRGFEGVERIWRQVPLELQAHFVAVIEVTISQMSQQGENNNAAELRQRLDIVQRIRSRERRTQEESREQQFRQMHTYYLEKYQEALTDTQNIAVWQEAITAASGLLAGELAILRIINRTALLESIANTYNSFGNALAENGDQEAAVQAYDQAILLQPAGALWRRNRANALMKLGRLDEAHDELARAGVLEPNAA